jgi:hypothetical protein
MEATVSVDGRPVDTIDVRGGILELDSDRLYTLFDDTKTRTGTIRVEFRGRTEVYAFTFG